MEAIKIDIKKENIDLVGSTPEVLFYQPSEEYSTMIKGDIPNYIPKANVVKYRLLETSRPYRNFVSVITHYLVKEEDEAILKLLLGFTQEEYTKSLRECFDNGKALGIVSEHNRIRHLPWWRRLFNKLDDD